MSRIFDIVQSLTGQKNNLVVPRQFLRFFAGDQQAYQLAAILNQIIFWSGHSTRDDGWFYKTHEELGEEVELSSDQVRRVVDKLSKAYLAGILSTANKRTANGDKVKHYHLDGDALIEKLFPATLCPKEKKVPDSPDGNGEVAEPEPHNRQSGTAEAPLPGSGEVAVPILYTDQYTDLNIQILNYRPRTISEQTKRFLERHPDAVDGVYTAGGRSWGNQDDVVAASYVFKRALNINASLGEPNWIEWANDIRLLRNARNVTHKQVCEVFRWANKHHFWSTNILSPSGLRRKWDNLVAQMGCRSAGAGSGGLDWDNTDWAEGVLG
ncbi:replication protein 15 [Citrobacter sp. Cf136]|uniref:replication protein 15 n=1 Tax=Citrobacter sp. Cf136 TaxID=2985081 RepID=UPI0025784C77|nr:replication protein 15 [Citrobacter sp. Cf136]MDM3093130.1 replication protein 15 [Citrobacter sp. Cf136]